MISSLPPGVAALINERRLGESGPERQRFSVSRQEALERLRRRELEDPWDWTLGLVRAAKWLGPLGAVWAGGGQLVLWCFPEHQVWLWV